MVSARDNDAIEKANKALQESEAKFRSLVETSPDIIWEIDLQGKILFLSPMVKTMLGYTPEELIGKTITDLTSEWQQEFVRQELARIISSEGPLSPFEVPARHRNGHDLVLEIRPSRVTGTEGTLTGLRGVARDITERKRTEEGLRLANRQLNLLTGMTRHDILNQLTALLMYLGVAREKTTDPETIGDMDKTLQLASMIQTQIEFTRDYQDLGTHAPKWIDLDTVMPRLHVPKKITLNADVKGVLVFADPMLEKVFFNLLDNSIRHGQRVTEIRVSSQPSGRDLVMVWEDNGVGIALDEKERIFERGFGKNTGFGLFLVHEILSLTGITIRETGEPGKGARFEIRVPKDMWRLAESVGRIN